MTRFFGVLLLILVLGLGVFAGWWLRGKFAADARVRWEGERTELLASVKVLSDSITLIIDTHRADSINNAHVVQDVDALQAQVNQARDARVADVRRLTKRLGELQDRPENAPELSRIAGEAIRQAEAAEERADSLDQGITRLRAVYDTQVRNYAQLLTAHTALQVKTDSLVNLAERAPIYDEERFFGLKLPSRKTMFIAGGITATVTTLVIVAVVN